MARLRAQLHGLDAAPKNKHTIFADDEQQARRFKELERENLQLRRAVADLTLDKLILKEAAEGNF